MEFYSYKLNYIPFVMNEQIQLINKLENKINYMTLNIIFENKFDEVKSQFIKMSRVFNYLNNIRSLLLSRKYVNRIISREIENNKYLKISKNYFLNDVRGFKLTDEKN